MRIRLYVDDAVLGRYDFFKNAGKGRKRANGNNIAQYTRWSINSDVEKKMRNEKKTSGMLSEVGRCISSAC